MGGILLIQKSSEWFISRISRLFWFTSEPPVMWAGGRTCWLREQDDTSPLPVFHRSVSGRCTVRLLTCALWTGLWRGSFPVHSLPSSNTHKQQILAIFAPSLPNCSSPPLQPLSQFQCSVIPCLTSPNSPEQSFTCLPVLLSSLPKSWPCFLLRQPCQLSTGRSTDLLPYSCPALLSLRSKGSMGNKK